MRDLMIFGGVTLGLGACVVVPFAFSGLAADIWGWQGSQFGFAVGLLLMLLISFGVVYASIVVPARSARHWLLKHGQQCDGYVKTFERISLTQHRVVLQILDSHGGSVGRVYVVSGVDERWLAHVCGTSKRIQMLAHPESDDVMFLPLRPADG